jgi:type I restriction enzyme S subunit
VTLPDGWTSRTYADLGTWYGGGTPSKGNPSFWKDGDVPWLSPKDMGDEVLRSVQLHITRAAIEHSAVRRVPANSVAVVVRSGILERTLPVALVPFATTMNQDMKAVAPTPDIDARWLAWGLRSAEQQLLRDCRKRGTTVASIEMPRWYAQRMPVPPLREQVRIVEMLEDHLSRLDAAGIDLVRARERTRALELASVNALLRDAGAVRRPLADLLDLSIGGVWGSAPGDDECDVDVLRVTELRPRGRLDPMTSARRSVNKKVLASRQLEPGDLLLEKSGGGPKQPVGRVGLVQELRGPSVCSNFMQLMRPRRSLVEPGFLHLYLNALHQSGGTSHLQRASTNIRNIKASEYLALQIPVPDLEIQRRGLASALASAAEVDRLRSAIDGGQRRSSALRKALLAAAFSGRLTSPAMTHDSEESADV